MADLSNCAFPYDLNAAAIELLNSAGAIVGDINNQIAQADLMVPAINAAIDQGNNLIDSLLKTGQNTSLTSGDAISAAFGLLPDPATTTDAEVYMSYTDFYIIAGVMYIAGKYSADSNDRTNVEILRRLYYACGKDMAKVDSFLSNKVSAVYYNGITQQILPQRSDSAGGYTLPEIKTILNATYLQSDDFITMPLNQALVLTDTFLDQDRSIEYIDKKYSSAVNSYYESIIHYLTIDNSVASTQKWVNYGFTQSQISQILAGLDNSSSTNPFSADFTALITFSNQITSEVNTLFNKLQTINPIAYLAALNKILADLQTLNTMMMDIIAKSRFQVTVVLETDTLSNLRAKLTNNEIIHLLEELPQIKGIYFGAPVSLYTQLINNLSNLGTTSVSNRYLNQSVPGGTNAEALIMMLSYIVQAQALINSATLITPNTAQYLLTSTNELLAEMIATDPYTEPTTTTTQSSTTGTTATTALPLQGVTSVVSPANIIIQNANFDSSFTLDVNLGILDDALKKLEENFSSVVAQPMAQVLKNIAIMIQNLNKNIDLVTDNLNRNLSPIKQRLDIFMSKYLSLVGQGQINSSLLKCAINFNIGISTPLLDDLQNLIGTLSALAKNLVASVFKIIATLINKLLCIIPNMINSLTGSLQGLIPLPGICSIPAINLGTDMTSALNALLALVNVRNAVFTSFNMDLVKFRAVISSAGDKMLQFRSSAGCNTPASQGFVNAALLNISGGVLPNPVGALSTFAGGL